MDKKSSIAKVIKQVLIILTFLAFMFPFLLIIINSVKPRNDVILLPLSLPTAETVTLSNFVNAFKEMGYLSAFANSLLVTSVSVFFIILFSSMAGFYFARSKGIFSRIAFGLMVSSMVIPFQVIMIPLVSIYGSSLGLINQRSTLIIDLFRNQSTYGKLY